MGSFPRPFKGLRRYQNFVVPLGDAYYILNPPTSACPASINVSGSHITQGTAKMNDSYFNSATYNNTNQHDFDELNTIYAHLDSTTTIAAASASSQANEVTNDPYSWGMLVSQSASGRSSIYEREHTDGTKTLTHVYWAPEAAANCPSCGHRYDH